ncbi:MAG: invasion associated locus B family protein [Gammaproteobacteria bacterium]|nr:invasion associated locus B family protein [Gammaproteobacteria bacterium]
MSIHKIKTILVTTIMFSLLAAPFQLAAEEKVKSFKDWGYKCETPKGFDQEICFIFQSITNKKNQSRIADITVAYTPKAINKSNKPLMVITMPLGVFLPPGIQLRVDKGKEAARAPFIQCIQDGCQARAVLDDKMMSKLKSGNKLGIAFFTPQQKQLGFPVSLDGFTDAIDSLKPKESTK